MHCGWPAQRRWVLVPIVALLGTSMACSFALAAADNGQLAPQATAAPTAAAGQPQLPSEPSAPLGITPLPTLLPFLTAEAAPTAALPDIASLRPNAQTFLAAYAGTPPNIDGDISDWPELYGQIANVIYKPENWSGSADLSATFAAAWDSNNLYLALNVTDDAHVQTEQGRDLFKGDGVDLLLDANLVVDADFPYPNFDDYQIGLSPGALQANAPFAQAYRWYPLEQAASLPEVLVAARPTDGGYQLEAAIPWSTLGVAIADNRIFGFVMSVSDNDLPNTADQQTLLSSTPGRDLGNPTTWDLLQLTD